MHNHYMVVDEDLEPFPTWEETPTFLQHLVPMWPIDDSVPSIQEYLRWAGRARWQHDHSRD